MTTFYFIRHGQADFSEANTKIYQGHGLNLIPLSEIAREQIEAAIIQIGKPLTIRGEALTLAEFAGLSNYLGGQ